MTAHTVKLGDVIEINPQSNYSLASDSDVAFLAMADISEDGQILATQTRPLSEVAKGYTSFRNGDVLLAKITPCFENGKAALVHDMFSDVAFGSTEFHVLRPTEEIDGRYLYHLVWNPAFRAAGARRMTGSAGQKRVPAAFLSDFEIVLPRFEEQKRIAAILDKADSLRRKRQQAIRLADEFLRAVFLDMFGDPVTNPKGLPKLALGELIKLKSGEFLPASEMSSEGSIPVYGGNGINGYHDEKMFDESQIVIGRVGAYCGAVHQTEAPCWVTDNALYVAEKSPDLHSDYLLFALRQANLNQYASQSGQPLVSGGRIYPVEILVPDMPKQDTFAQIIQRRQALSNSLVSSEMAVARLGKSLQSNFF